VLCGWWTRILGSNLQRKRRIREIPTNLIQKLITMIVIYVTNIPHRNVSQWADDIVENQPLIRVNDDGTKTIITYRLNDEGKKVRVTQKVREVIVKENVNKEVAKRKKWAKFGEEKNSAPGPDFRTTQVGESVTLRLGTSWKAVEKEEEEKKADEAKLGTNSRSITCRYCKGAHFSARCPFKDSLASLEPDPVDGGADDAGAAAGAGSGKFVPRHLRPGATQESGRDRDDSTTLKINNLNEIVDEEMLKNELLYGFGPIVRVNVVRNRETGRSKGLAFVQFASERTAQQALDVLDGRGYHSLIIQVGWSKPKK
jgi:translation initiation factor 3 subunit G